MQYKALDLVVEEMDHLTFHQEYLDLVDLVSSLSHIQPDKYLKT